MSSIKDDLKSFRRSWVHHTGMQLATLTVLSATFFVIAFVLSLSLNLRRILASWGNGVQLTVYLNDDVDRDGVSKLKRDLAFMNHFSEVAFVPRETATENFRNQMASYAPDLLSDADFSNPFPASFRLTLKGGVATDRDVSRLESIASEIQRLSGVEDVSYGQGWVHNYSAFVASLCSFGGLMALILVAGSLFVIGNSIRTSITARREEIEILELVGATAGMIRRPFIMEGLAMGGLAAMLALSLNALVLTWQKSLLFSSLVMSRLAPLVGFLDVKTVISFSLCGAALGAIGAWLTVRRLNDGWSAVRNLET